MAATLRAQAIRLLARREYARAELEERLLAKKGARDVVRVLLDELEGQGYLSNERYARAIASQNAGRYSRRSIAAQLKARGVGSEDIAAALAEASPDDGAALEALWRRRFGAAPTNEREKARQVRFLQARGFALSAILKLLRQVA
ncbi:MAG TPA: regulatory protein RecX [Casimicrobiaceae bacterium]|nr:regulatory protein RecX [Casimicrobiaceae bacterium]